MPLEILSHPRLTGDARLLAAYLWALASWQSDSMIRTTMAALAGVLAMPESSVRGHMANLAAEGYVSAITSRRGRPECGGGAEFVVYGPAALAERLRLNRPADSAQTRLPLAAADELVERCRETAKEIGMALSKSRPHAAYQMFVIAGAMFACGVAIEVNRAASGHSFGMITLTREQVMSAVEFASRQALPGKVYYYSLAERLTVAAGEKVRMPSEYAIRAACAKIGWPWKTYWRKSPFELNNEWRTALAEGDSRTYAEWIAAQDARAT